MSATQPFLNSGKSRDEILSMLHDENEREDARLNREEVQARKSIPDYDRALPRLYLDVAELRRDPRRMLFAPGGAALYDSLILCLAESPGAKFPWRNSNEVVARALGAPVDDVKAMLDVAIEEGLLLNDRGSLSSPLVTKAHRDAVKKCAINAISGKKGGKTPKRKRS